MSDAEQTAVEEADVNPEGSSEADGAQDLDSLLKEFDQDEPTSATEGKSSSSEEINQNDLKELLSYVKEDRENKIRDTAAKNLEETISSIKGEDMKNVPDKIVKGLLFATAEDNPKFLAAYQNRKSNPDAWKKVEKSLQKDLKSMLDGLSDKSEEKRKRVADAVLNAKSESSDVTPESLSQMSSKDFAAYKNKVFKGTG